MLLLAVAAFAEPVVLLAGGYDKRIDLGPLADVIACGAKAAALMGQAKAWGAAEFRPLKAAGAIPETSDPIAGQEVSPAQLVQTAQTEPASQADAAWQAYGRRDWQQALEIWSLLAAEGDPEAQNMLGVMHENGEGVKPDLAKAAEWFSSYQAKCAKALFASAIRCMLVRVWIAVPSPLNASRISCASVSQVGRPFFARHAARTQRNANDTCLLRFTGMGTW